MLKKLTLFLLLLAPIGAENSTSPSPGDVRSQSKRLTSAPFILSTHALVQVTLYGQEGYVVVDTGAPVSSLFSKGQALATEHGIDIKAKTYDVPFTFGTQELAVPFYYDKSVAAQSVNIEHFFPDFPLFGILGGRFLDQYTAQFDYINNQFNLYDYDSLPLPEASELSGEYILFDVELGSQGHVLIPDVTVVGSAGPFQGYLNLDTGASHFLIDPKTVPRKHLRKPHFESVQVGNMSWEQVEFRTRPISMFLRDQRLIGELGVPQFSNTVLTLFYDQLKVTIKRDQSAERGGSLGMRIEKPEDKNGAPIVTMVKESGRAESLGLKVGDEVVQINQMPIFNMYLASHALKNRPAHQPLQVSIKRDGSILTLKEENAP